jgi:hypothetical protein
MRVSAYVIPPRPQDEENAFGRRLRGARVHDARAAWRQVWHCGLGAVLFRTRVSCDIGRDLVRGRWQGHDQ